MVILPKTNPHSAIVGWLGSAEVTCGAKFPNPEVPGHSIRSQAVWRNQESAWNSWRLQYLWICKVPSKFPLVNPKMCIGQFVDWLPSFLVSAPPASLGYPLQGERPHLHYNLILHWCAKRPQKPLVSPLSSIWEKIVPLRTYSCLDGRCLTKMPTCSRSLVI